MLDVRSDAILTFTIPQPLIVLSPTIQVDVLGKALTQVENA
ncbi:hypothetical protein ABIB73_006780 [Bradyrhizobium sp. F1.4.3]